MLTARPLRLKQQEVKRSEKSAAATQAIARVWVDNGVAHLDGVYDYLIPASFSEIVRAGVRITVPFAGREVEALVIERTENSDVTNLKFVSKVISPLIIARPELLALLEKAAKRWVCHPFDIFKMAVPPRVASAEKGVALIDPVGKKKAKKGQVSYLHIPPHEEALKSLADFARREVSKGSVLVILPEERELKVFVQALESNCIQLTSSAARSIRYSNFLVSLQATNQIVVGTRSAIFATPGDLETIIVYRDSSESHFEVRHPGWNVRDLALLRQESESINLIFAGTSPSLELARAVEDGEIKFLTKRSRLSVLTFPRQPSELLPGRIFSHIRAALKVGSVLFLAPKKGYASALICSKCRNFAICGCGGKISRNSQQSDPKCVHCGTEYSNFKCSWCENDKFALLGRGSRRHAEEIGRAFPGYPVISSDAENSRDEPIYQTSLVIATAGMAPPVIGGYAAVVILETDTFFSYSDLRGQERSREALFDAASRVRSDGEVLLSIQDSHPIVSALASWSPKLMYRRELIDLMELKLPPHYRAAVIDTSTKEASSIADGLRKALLDLRIPKTANILGPAKLNVESARITITCTRQDFEELTDFLSSFVKHRAITKKPPIRLRIDPYSLSD